MFNDYLWIIILILTILSSISNNNIKVDKMTEDKITITFSKKTLLFILIILSILFLPLPSYETLPAPCPLLYRIDGPNPPCPTKKGWVLTKPIFFRIVDFIKFQFIPQGIGGSKEPGEGTSSTGIIEPEETTISNDYLDSPKPQLGDAANKEECDVKGGVWQKWGLGGFEYCQIPASDAGESCMDGNECEYGKCISQKGEIPGSCVTYKNTFGCMSFLENGKLGPTLCID